MMSFTDIHSCSKVVADNGQLKLKINWLLQRKKELESELAELKNYFDASSAQKRLVPTKCVAIQTDLKSWVFWQSSKSKQRHQRQQSDVLKDSDILKINKVVEMHSLLLKRYDKEVKMNMSYADTISDLNVRLSESEGKVRSQKEKIVELERDLLLWKAKCKGRYHFKNSEGDPVLREVVQERNKLVSENSRLKMELKGLDANFFDEVEDVKYALLQSSKLNKEYEKALKGVCDKYGIPCPSPGMLLNNV